MPTPASMGQALRRSPTCIGMAFMTMWSAAIAQPVEGGAPEGRRRGPPPEALAACASLGAGADCSVTLGSKTLKGTCWAPEGKPLACRPEGAPPPAGTRPAVGTK